jgi:hypothetical protein
MDAIAAVRKHLAERGPNVPAPHLLRELRYLVERAEVMQRLGYKVELSPYLAALMQLTREELARLEGEQLAFHFAPAGAPGTPELRQPAPIEANPHEYGDWDF